MRKHFLASKLSTLLLLSFTTIVPTIATEKEKPIAISSVPVCYNFGCKVKDTIAITEEEWPGVAGWFTPQASTAAEERQQIRQALGWMEVVVGKHTPTHRDKGLNLPEGAQFPGQLDCIDESMNTTTYLRLFEKEDLLTHHKVSDRAYRRALFNQHWAGQVEDLKTGKRYVFDSWFQDNGFLSYLQPSSEWKSIRFLYSSYIDNMPE